MGNFDNYPAGLHDRSRNVPWNEPEVPEKEFGVVCSQTLSKSDVVVTSNYIPGASGVDYEPDDEGGYCASAWHDPDDTSITNWNEEWADNDHYTPLQLIELYKETLKKQLESWEGMEDTSAVENKINNLKYLIQECEGWVEDDCEFIEE